MEYFQSSWPGIGLHCNGCETATDGTHFSCRLDQIWSGSFSTVTAPQGLISAGMHCWSPAASGQCGAKTVTVWWPPLATKRKGLHAESLQAEPPAAATPGGSAASQPIAQFSAETQRIMSKLGGEVNTAGSEVEAEENEEEEMDRDWTLAEQLRHPMGLVSLQWTPGSLQRGLTFFFRSSQCKVA